MIISLSEDNAVILYCLQGDKTFSHNISVYSWITKEVVTQKNIMLYIFCR